MSYKMLSLVAEAQSEEASEGSPSSSCVHLTEGNLNSHRKIKEFMCMIPDSQIALLITDGPAIISLYPFSLYKKNSRKGVFNLCQTG